MSEGGDDGINNGSVFDGTLVTVEMRERFRLAVIGDDPSPYSPERTLWADVLLWLVMDAMDPMDSERRQEAIDLIFADYTASHICSLPWICDVLNLDVEKIRERVAKDLDSSASSSFRKQVFASRCGRVRHKSARARIKNGTVNRPTQRAREVA